MEPYITIGISEGERLTVELHGAFRCNGRRIDGGRCLFSKAAGGVQLAGEVCDRFTLDPDAAGARFTIFDVTIGKEFHWQQKENQTFGGSLSVMTDGHRLIAVNRTGIEDYLLSVISSEMNAGAPEEFLKAHAVISRSWALAQIYGTADSHEAGCVETPDETVRWYDHAAHRLFDVCADDHCQRYQGLTKATTQAARNAVDTTRGEVLTYEGRLCDARFSKCCGGITEKFSTCWQPTDFGYLGSFTDTAAARKADVSDEGAAREWITGHPDAFCADPAPEVLATILNSYDRATPHLYRWKVEYTAAELADIVRRRTGRDYGLICALEPLHRGPSGRIDRLRICGTRLTRTIGKELEIRRSLSETHLYSSAFVAEQLDEDADGIPRRWVIRGAGWGHGVGLCQIGAAVMATRGYGYRDILNHYFPGASISDNYGSDC